MPDAAAPEHNPALVELEPFTGRWRMELYGADFLPDPETKVTGVVEIDWIENGAAVVLRQGDGSLPPAATWIVGRDESGPAYQVLYSDNRGVSRIYEMTLADRRWTMARRTSEFSQRFHAELDVDGSVIRGRWEKSVDGGATWEHDFHIDYIRS